MYKAERTAAKDAIASALRLVHEISIQRWPMFARYRNPADATHIIDALRDGDVPRPVSVVDNRPEHMSRIRDTKPLESAYSGTLAP